MQNAKVIQVLQQDLKVTISSVKKDEHQRALEGAHDLLALEFIERKVRTDSQLTQDDRVQLLGDIERATAMASRRQ